MARDTKYDILFEPIRIGPKTLKNRFYQTPHCMGGGSEKPGFQAAHRGIKAEGGWGAVCTEYCSIHPESDDTHRVSARLWDAEDVRNLARMCDAVHASDALAGVELWYGGPHAPCMESRAVPRAPSQLASDIDPLTVPMEVSEEEIRELQGFWVEAARRARSAGFDIVYIYGSNSYGPMQFLSPFYNRRTDRYGGSFENRARFWRETLELVREAVGDDCAIASRLAVESLCPAGVTFDEAAKLVQLVDHLVDLWDINVSGIVNWGEDIGTSRFFREGYQLEWTGRIKEFTSKPVVGVGRFTSPDTMVEVIESGRYDIIGAARATIADPFLPRKIEEGRLDDIRECIGCNICVSRWEIGGPPLVCSQNATAGEEYRRGWHPEKFTRAANADNDVLVIGAGAAGMECARVLGMRGMRRVHLVEASPEIGGYVGWVSTLPGLGEWARVVNYRRIQLSKLRNVEVLTGTRIDAKGAREYGAEIVVVASGARWATDGLSHVTHEPIPGADARLTHVLTPEQVMLEGKNAPGDRVVVYDCEGYFMGVGLAEKLALKGKRITYVTPNAHPGAYMHFTGEMGRLHQLLHRLEIRVVTERVIDRIEPGEVTTGSIWVAGDSGAIEADSVVLVTQRLSNHDLYRELETDREALEREGIRAVYRVGDCAAPRLIADCVFDGHRLAREIDSPDPALPLPFIRERRLVGETSDAEYEAQLARPRDSVAV
ncbi:MAG: FAD-dependent oxidoreductase [Thermoleophilia bacterium]|nr:FAD-dependent oxidoreductase [Thermoleophilia bacterium]